MSPTPLALPTGEGGSGSGSDEQRPFIPAEARPAVVEDLARIAWQVAEALLSLETPPR
ncbi:hypothetical protein ACIBCT_37515 [Streptosporangium sp. NPDC050855]|uniref:hypothetical protein n=1 Tax=Streptosporangium sp. NPDC050855 TaxID=3366194 RepID=UPI0037992A15